MTVETRVDEALERVATEQDEVSTKRDAYNRFETAVREIPADGQTTAGAASAGGAVSVATAARCSTDRCREVRDSFAETVAPILDDESLLKGVGEELSEQIALAIAPKTDGRFSPQVKQVVLSATRKRVAELDAMARALDSEDASLRDARKELTEITEWLVSTDETPLSEISFAELCDRHEQLETHRDCCDQLARERQQKLDATTGAEGAAGMEHRQLVGYLYAESSTRFPVLSTVTRLDSLCEDAQEAVRAHLTCRG